MVRLTIWRILQGSGPRVSAAVMLGATLQTEKAAKVPFVRCIFEYGLKEEVSCPALDLAEESGTCH